MIDALGEPQSLLLIGGTSEIGQAILTRLSRSGRLQRVVLAGRQGPSLDDAANSLAGRIPDVRSVAMDMTDLDAIPEAVDQAFADGDLDVVVLAAGVLPGADADPGETAIVNFVGPMVAGTRVMDHFQRQGHGVLVVLSTVAAERPRADNYLYGATKAGLDAWANGLADTLTGNAVRVLVVRPGMVRTRMSRHLPEAPMTVEPEAVAEAVKENLVRGPVTVWVPAQLRFLMSGLRHLPRPVFRKVAATRGGSESTGAN